MSELIDITEIAQRYAMPAWLQPHKNRWVSKNTLMDMVGVEGGGFSAFFEHVRPRLRTVQVTARNGHPSTQYLLKQVWAVARAHGFKLIPRDGSKSAESLLSEAKQTIATLEYRLRTADDNLRKVQPQLRAQEAWLDLRAEDFVALVFSMTEPKALPGVYFLLDDAGRVVYVGQSQNVLGRMSGHTEKGFTTVRMIAVEDKTKRTRMETQFIRFLRPPKNITGMAA